MRPRRSVWSVPQRLGTFITQRLWTFIMQAAGTEGGCPAQAGPGCLFPSFPPKLAETSRPCPPCPGLIRRASPTLPRPPPPHPPPQALTDKGGGTCPSSRKAEAPRAPSTALKPEAPSSVARAAGNAVRDAAGVAGPDRPGSAVSALRSSHAGCMPQIAEIAPFFKIKQES